MLALFICSPGSFLKYYIPTKNYYSNNFFSFDDFISHDKAKIREYSGWQEPGPLLFSFYEPFSNGHNFTYNLGILTNVISL